MSFLVFYTDLPLPHNQMPNLSALMPKGFNTREEAITYSCKLIANNCIVWKIEGENNLIITREEIEYEYLVRTGNHAHR